MKLLIHICCAPCSVYCIESLRAEGISLDGYFFNPNIHPFTEYRARRDTVTEYAKSIGLPLKVEDDYGLREFVANTVSDLDNRCSYCYRTRLERTAEYAAANGYGAFTTTLFVSPYQNHELLRSVGESAANKYGTTLLYRDFRPGFREGQKKARELNLYMQKYCGCIFSEEERYSKRK